MGNKADLEDDRLVPAEDGQRLADELGRREYTHCLPLTLSLSEDGQRLADELGGRDAHTHTHTYTRLSLATLKDRLTLVYIQYTPRK